MEVVRGDDGGDFPERAGAEAGTGGGGSGERVCVHVAGAAASVAGVVREGRCKLVYCMLREQNNRRPGQRPTWAIVNTDGFYLPS